MKMNDPQRHFIPGIELGRSFYWEAVRPILDRRFSGLPHAAAHLGPGSDVLGFDDATSMDHDWGPRTMLFLQEKDHKLYAEAIRFALAQELPYKFRGYPTSFAAPDPDDGGTQQLQPKAEGPINHHVTVYTARGFFREQLAVDVDQELEAADWLTLPEQKLLSVTAGAVHDDQVGLEALRARFEYYPRDVWLYRLAASWARIGQQEHLVGRAGQAGDAIGSALLGASLVRDIMRLCFAMERRYAPYAKWLGTAFKQLDCAQDLVPTLQMALQAADWRARERQLVKAYSHIAARHNDLRLTERLSEEPRPFHSRPLRVIEAERFATALLERIQDPEVRRIAALPPIGATDQFSDSTDLLSHNVWRPMLRKLYR